VHGVEHLGHRALDARVPPVGDHHRRHRTSAQRGLADTALGSPWTATTVTVVRGARSDAAAASRYTGMSADAAERWAASEQRDR
jgi:hypothetical protein